jgi:hypothetical protein
MDAIDAELVAVACVSAQATCAETSIEGGVDVQLKPSRWV